jgi:DNA-directed RNA polymerase specialized sigma24 family protein
MAKTALAPGRRHATRRALPTDRIERPRAHEGAAATDAVAGAAVVLRFYLDLSIDSTAEALGKSPGTVRALTSQGIARLREDLGPSWLEERDDETAVP